MHYGKVELQSGIDEEGAPEGDARISRYHASEWAPRGFLIWLGRERRCGYRTRSIPNPRFGLARGVPP
jgi:hypothetical protein